MVDLIPVKNFSEFYSKNKEFIDDKFLEASGSKDINIDTDLYQAAIDSGTASIFSIEKDGSFIGYISLIVSSDPLHKGELSAIVDHFALDKEHRNKGVATYVMKELEALLEGEGIRELQLCLTTSSTHEKIAGGLGYHAGVVYYKKVLRSDNG